MKCQILFSRKNKKKINLSSAELAQVVGKLNKTCIPRYISPLVVKSILVIEADEIAH